MVMLYYKMKKNIIFGLTALLLSLLYTQPILAQEIEQEPKPPQQFLFQNSNLETKIAELNNLTKNLHEIIMEQIKVIMNLVSKLKMITFDKSLSSITDF